MGFASVDVDIDGPVVEGTGRPIVNAAVADIEKAIAEAGAKLVRTHLDSVLRHPTGRYLRNIGVIADSRGIAFTDSGIAYGPWLEGLDSRNKTSRFRGYQSFRRARQKLEGDAAAIAAPDIRRMTDKLE